MREKEIWEESRHGLEIISLILRYLTNNEETYTEYVHKLDEIVGGVSEDYSCYLPIDALITRPVLLCVYLVERVCLECGCCGMTSINNANSGGGVLRKVNFSPVLDKRAVGAGGKKAAGDVSLDPPLLTKMHGIHLILTRILDPYHKSKLRLLTLCKVQELAREMDGFTGLVLPPPSPGHQQYKQGSKLVNSLRSLTGEFYRQGILLKLNKRKGLQNRIFFLFRDTLIYGTRLSSTQGFRLHGIILTRNMELLDASINLSSIPYSFSLVVKSDLVDSPPETTVLSTFNPSPLQPATQTTNEKILILAAFSQLDHDLWVEAVGKAIRESVETELGTNGDTNNDELGGRRKRAIASRLFNSSEELLNNNLNKGISLGEGIEGSRTEIGNACHNRSNALSHVCWHRNISIDGWEVVEKEKHQISGPLLRKFKNSPGWQRLWVVFTHSCLYFYKNANETVPLASLPLLGYKIELLSEEEKSQVTKEHVFKLVFKAHVYYFRAESGYTFGRWVGVLRNAMMTGGMLGNGQTSPPLIPQQQQIVLSS